MEYSSAELTKKNKKIDAFYISIFPTPIEVLKGKIIKKGNENVDILKKIVFKNINEYNTIKNSLIFDQQLEWDHSK
jgi:hypothetical protein